jgi:2-desacetyl-2-hydroxyethyl bacteriochlorophyllide A dehydrogenase
MKNSSKTKSAAAVVFEGVNKVTVKELGVPECKPSQIGVETLFSFVSPGTELRTLAGHYGAREKFPLVPGYSCVGRVTELGAEVKTFRAGDLVSCRSGGEFIGAASHFGGQASYHVHNAGTAVLLPQNANPVDYAITEVAAISLRGVEGACPRPGETALIIGQGLIGAFSEEFLRLRGCKTVVCDFNGDRVKGALERGAAAGVSLSDPNAEDYIKGLGFGSEGGFDIVVESSGSIPGLEMAGRMTRALPSFRHRDSLGLAAFAAGWPRLILQANYIDSMTHSDPRSLIKSEGVVIIMPNDRGVDDRKKVIEHIRRGEVNTQAYTKDIFSPDQMPDCYQRLAGKELFSVVCKWS